MTAPPIYVLTMKGSCELAAQTGDCSLILTVEPTFRDWMSLNHYCALADLHWKIDTAINAQSYVKQHGLYFEHEVICSSAKEPWKKYRLNTRVSDKLYCCPDSAFETEVNGCRRAWMVEREMGSDTPGRVMAKKHKGHHALAAGKLYQRWFPQAADMRVLAVCPNAGWRDLLRREFIERHGELTKLKPGAELWLFVDVHDVTPEKFLHEPIFYTVDRGPLPFVPRPAASPAGGA